MKLTVVSKSHHAAIIDLHTQVFSDAEGASEGTLIGKLVQDLVRDTPAHDLYGFVALENKQVIGSIFFSRLTFENGINAFILSPVAVHTEYQGQGIGQQLIKYGIQALKEKGVEFVVTYGDPAFYQKVGFNQISEDVVKAPLPLSYPHGWLCQRLDGGEMQPISEQPHCVAALNHAEYW